MIYTKNKQPINYNYRRISFHNNEAVLAGINQHINIAYLKNKGVVL